MERTMMDLEYPEPLTVKFMVNSVSYTRNDSLIDILKIDINKPRWIIHELTVPSDPINNSLLLALNIYRRLSVGNPCLINNIPPPPTPPLVTISLCNESEWARFPFFNEIPSLKFISE